MEDEEIQAKIDELAAKIVALDDKIEALTAKVEALESAKSSPVKAAEEEEGEEGHNVSPSDVAYEENEPKKVSSKDGRVKCPKCGNLNFKTLDDKSKILSYVAGKPVYGKKFQCPKCGSEWK
jgi:ribosomal protein S27AE